LSDVFIGHPRHRRLFPNAPKIGSSHHMPSRLIAVLGALGFIRMPPVVLLVRQIPDSLISYFFKWREAKALGELSDYLARAPRAQGIDLWWFIRVFNRWGRLKQVFPRAILVVRYEDLQCDPATWVRRIWSHWGVELSQADLAAAMSVASRIAVQACLDPSYGEDIAPDPAARAACCYSAGETAVLDERLAHYLRHAFGYVAATAAQPETMDAAEPVRLVA
jgi:hypothetical protein